EIPFSAETKRVLNHAAADADALSDHDIGTEHLLLGLLREGSSVAASIMTRHGMTLEEARVAIIDLRPKYGTGSSDALPGGVRPEIDAIKGHLHRIRRVGNEQARAAIDRIEKDLDDLKRYFE